MSSSSGRAERDVQVPRGVLVAERAAGVGLPAAPARRRAGQLREHRRPVWTVRRAARPGRPPRRPPRRGRRTAGPARRPPRPAPSSSPIAAIRWRSTASAAGVFGSPASQVISSRSARLVEQRVAVVLAAQPDRRVGDHRGGRLLAVARGEQRRLGRGQRQRRAAGPVHLPAVERQVRAEHRRPPAAHREVGADRVGVGAQRPRLEHHPAAPGQRRAPALDGGRAVQSPGRCVTQQLGPKKPTVSFLPQ